MRQVRGQETVRESHCLYSGYCVGTVAGNTTKSAQRNKREQDFQGESKRTEHSDGRQRHKEAQLHLHLKRQNPPFNVI